MNEELANLLIRITSVGFDEVLQSLREVEEAARRVSSGGGFAKLQDTLDEIASSLDEFKEGMRSATHGFTTFGAGAQQSGTQLSKHTQEMQKNLQILGTLAKAYASFWVMFNAPRKFFATLDGVAQFNRQLSTMAVLANMSRESLIGLGAAAGTFGGSSSDAADLASRAELAMQSFRMGQGGGAFEQAAQMYGLSLAGTGAGGLMQGEEALDNIVAAMEKLPNMADKLGLKSLLGISDAMFQVMLKGTKAWEEAKKSNAEYAQRLADAKARTEEWNAATAELKKEWEILKTQVLADLVPLVKPLIEIVTSILKKCQEFHGVISAVFTIVTAIGTAIAAWKFAQMVKTAWGLVKALRAAAAAGSALGAVGGGAGAVGGLVGKANPISVVAGVVDAFTGFVQRQVQIHSLSVAEQHLATWHNEWRAFTLYSNTGHADKDGNGYSLSKDDFRSLLPDLSDEMKSAWLVAANNARQMKGYEYAVNEHEYNRRSRAAGEARAKGLPEVLSGWEGLYEESDRVASAVEEQMRSGEARAKGLLTGAVSGSWREERNGDASAREIRVTMHIGTVQSAAENYGDFVKEMLGNAKDVVAQRMETADWFDSNSGVIVA